MADESIHLWERLTLEEETEILQFMETYRQAVLELYHSPWNPAMLDSSRSLPPEIQQTYTTVVRMLGKVVALAIRHSQDDVAAGLNDEHTHRANPAWERYITTHLGRNPAFLDEIQGALEKLFEALEMR